MVDRSAPSPPSTEESGRAPRRPGRHRVETIDPLLVAREGAIHLAQLSAANGRFRYRFDPDRPEASTGYNILRHCGTIWAMADTANRAGPMPEVLDAARRATERLVERNIKPYGSDGARCVMSGDNTKLGGGGLAILALLEMAEATGQGRYRALARDLGRYILLERRPDGDFHHKRRYSTGELLPFESEYYTGEALFGLLRLYDATGEARWLEAAAASERQLARRDYGVAQQSHWMLYALEQLHRFDPQPVYRDHARRIVEDIIRSPAYRETDRSTPIACRSEGLLAFVRLTLRLPSSAEMEAEIDRCLAIVGENLELQLGYRQEDGSFIRGGGRREVRIDYIQHNISAFLAYGLLQDSAFPAA